ncbi:MAG TPA: Holliday junction branch migration protein RuvA [Candidatus Bathyarchaeia archaeon]|nr:Holliday junction branch migration protein RuvA [Candidatus Bathyarchaeia archaeon]
MQSQQRLLIAFIRKIWKNNFVMIGYLAGIIIKKESNSLIINVRGVGYRIFVPLYIWENCQLEDKKEFFIYTHVRETEISLFGFLTPAEEEIFIELISVSGIGPKLALNILSYSHGASRIIRAIQEADVDFFSSVKGLGKKNSQRVIVDLKPKLGGLKEIEFESEQDQDLIEALKGLGFSREEIKKSVKNINKDLPLAERIRQTLKNNQ